MANIRYITSSGAGSRNFYSPADALILWDGSTAPSGWSIETLLDGYFVMGGSSVDLTASGSSTHTHTNPGTNFTGSHNNHTITVATSGAPSATITAKDSASAQYTTSSHTHATGSTSNESWAGNHSHTISDTDSASNLPPYRQLRWIKSATYREIPIGGIVMQSVSSTALGGNWQVCDGTNGTPDMRGYFVYGGTGTAGGASSHSHTNPNSSNTGAHTHTVDVTSANNATWHVATNTEPSTEGRATVTTHKHTATGVSSSSGGAHDHTVNDTSSNTVLPPYIQLYFIQRIS